MYGTAEISQGSSRHCVNVPIHTTRVANSVSRCSMHLGHQAAPDCHNCAGNYSINTTVRTVRNRTSVDFWRCGALCSIQPTVFSPLAGYSSWGGGGSGNRGKVNREYVLRIFFIWNYSYYSGISVRVIPTHGGAVVNIASK